MLAADAPYPPAAYSGVWLFYGALLIVAAVVILIARRRLRTPHVVITVQPDPQQDLAAVRQAYLDEVEALGRRHAGGGLDDRELHHELSRAVRAYVAESNGPNATVMTPTDLRRAGRQDVAEVIGQFWGTQFGPRPDQSAPESVDAARRVILHSGGGS